MPLVTVIGATGRQGLAQMRQLLAAGYEVRAMSRSKSGFTTPEFSKVEIRSGDLYDEATLPEAFEGSEAIFVNIPLQARFDRSVLMGAVGRAGKLIGTKRVVWNTSSWIPDRAGDHFTYANNTRGINELWRTGVPGTVFGSVLFMDNLLTNWARPFIVDEGRYVYPHKPGLAANWISLDDVAKFMIASLDRPDFEGSWMNIGGPERLSPPQVAEALTAALGREIRYDPCTPAEFGRLLVGAFGDNMPEEMRAEFAKGIEDFYEYNNNAPTRPFEVDMDHVLDRLPIKLETLADWTKRQDWSGLSNDRPPAG